MTYDPATAVGQVRLLAGDRTEPFVYEDGEVEQFLALAGGVIPLAAVAMLRAWASDAARVAVSYRIGDRSLDKTAIAREKREAANALEAQHYRGGGYPGEAAEPGCHPPEEDG